MEVFTGYCWTSACPPSNYMIIKYEVTCNGYKIYATKKENK